jgi:hypothetical protein
MSIGPKFLGSGYGLRLIVQFRPRYRSGSEPAFKDQKLKKVSDAKKSKNPKIKLNKTPDPLFFLFGGHFGLPPPPPPFCRRSRAG